MKILQFIRGERTRLALAMAIQAAYEQHGGIGDATPYFLRGKKMGRLVDDGPELNQTLRHDHSGQTVCEACAIRDRQEDQTPGDNRVLELQRQLRAAETRAETAERLNLVLRNRVKSIASEVEEADSHLKAA